MRTSVSSVFLRENNNNIRHGRSRSGYYRIGTKGGDYLPWLRVVLVHADFVFLLLARQNKSKLSFCSCCVRRFGIAHASMALPSLNHNLASSHDIDALRGVGHAATLEVVDLG